MQKDEHKARAIWLVEIGDSEPPVFAFLEGEYYDDEEILDYHIDERCCPTDLLGFHVHWDSARNSHDPHGVVTFVQQIRRPDDWEQVVDKLALFDRVPDYLALGANTSTGDSE